jgi:hypothetical protein
MSPLCPRASRRGSPQHSLQGSLRPSPPRFPPPQARCSSSSRLNRSSRDCPRPRRSLPQWSSWPWPLSSLCLKR